MTDEQIIKALKCCGGSNCHECPIEGCTDDIFGNALDLINRLQAENEQGKEEANKYKNLWGIALDDIEIAKAKAYTRVTNLKKISRYIDDLVKEIMEVKENENQN